MPDTMGWIILSALVVGGTLFAIILYVAIKIWLVKKIWELEELQKEKLKGELKELQGKNKERLEGVG